MAEKFRKSLGSDSSDIPYEQLGFDRHVRFSGDFQLDSSFEALLSDDEDEVFEDSFVGTSTPKPIFPVHSHSDRGRSRIRSYLHPKMRFRSPSSVRDRSFSRTQHTRSSLPPDLERTQFGQSEANTSHFDTRQTHTNTTTPHKHRKQKFPDKFDGVSIDFRDFLVQFELIASWNEWTEVEKAQQLVMSLSGEARKMLSHIEPEKLYNFYSLKTTLTNRFCPAERKAAYATEFYSRVRKQNESVEDFGFDIRRLWFLAFPGESSGDVHMINAFVNGLEDRELRKHISLSHPKTLEAAVGLAIEYEAVVKSIHRSQSGESTVKSLVQAVKQTNRSPSPKHKSSEMEELTQTMKDCFLELAKEMKSAGHRKPICYNCNEEGHIAPRCPFRSVRSGRQGKSPEKRVSFKEESAVPSN